MSKQYSLEQIKIMNLSYPWNNSIKPKPEDLKTSSTDRYILHATGDADLNGRKYIPLPVGTEITPEIKCKYNLI
jgi:hypothetical protein